MVAGSSNSHKRFILLRVIRVVGVAYNKSGLAVSALAQRSHPGNANKTYTKALERVKVVGNSDLYSNWLHLLAVLDVVARGAVGSVRSDHGLDAKCPLQLGCPFGAVHILWIQVCCSLQTNRRQ